MTGSGQPSLEPPVYRGTAFVTGGSRGIGADTCVGLACAGFDVAFTYRNKAARAQEVAGAITTAGAAALPLQCDITVAADLARAVAEIRALMSPLRLLVLNASGGLERDLLAADPEYPMHVNRDAQLAVLDVVLPLLEQGATVVLVTSHWAHLYGRVPQLSQYEPIARSKHAGEIALRERVPALGLRLLVVTGDLVEGTTTAKLLERADPGVGALRSDAEHRLPTIGDMANAIVTAVLDETLPSGHTIVVGRELASLR